MDNRTQPRSLAEMLSRKSFNITPDAQTAPMMAQPKIKPLAADLAATQQYIYIIYKMIVEAKKMTIEDESDLRHNIQLLTEWMADPQQRPWCRLAGYVGNGKTTLLQAVRIWYDSTHGRERFNFFLATELFNLAVKEPERYEQIKLWPRLIIDDLGTEPQAYNAFGNARQPLRELFYQRYDRHLLTLYSTNLTEEDFSNFYGERIADRCREKETKIIITNKSYRRR